jgi:pyruvate/2-oxoglutarate dehydrogenase complex dihydrolipoamide dehydrogenase (E3) component
MPFKSTLPRLLAYYERALRQARVRVLCGVAPDPGSLDADAVVLATGSRWSAPSCVDALAKPESVGERVTVVGANTMGAETAWWLGGLGKRVTLVERDADFDDDVNLVQRLVLPKALADAGARVLFNSEWSGGGADPATDTVVLACGAQPHLPGALEAWRAGEREVQLAGECAGARALIGATASGYKAALRL